MSEQSQPDGLRLAAKPQLTQIAPAAHRAPLVIGGVPGDSVAARRLNGIPRSFDTPADAVEDAQMYMGGLGQAVGDQGLPVEGIWRADQGDIGGSFALRFDHTCARPFDLHKRRRSAIGGQVTHSGALPADTFRIHTSRM